VEVDGVPFGAVGHEGGGGGCCGGYFFEGELGFWLRGHDGRGARAWARFVGNNGTSRSVKSKRGENVRLMQVLKRILERVRC